MKSNQATPRDDKKEKLKQLHLSLNSLRSTLANLEVKSFDEEESAPGSPFSTYDMPVFDERMAPLPQGVPTLNAFPSSGFNSPVFPPRHNNNVFSPRANAPEFRPRASIDSIYLDEQENGWDSRASSFCGNLDVNRRPRGRRRNFSRNPTNQFRQNSTFFSPPQYPQLPPHSFQSMSVEKDPENVERKSKVCRHFLRGFCKLGNACNFTHGLQSTIPNDQIVFLGGLPENITAKQLKHELKEVYGVNVIKDVQIMSNYAPKVALESPAEAQSLIQKKSINIMGRTVDVRPFEDQLRTPEERSMVFLGGLPDDIKLAELLLQLKELGYPVVNRPRLGQGYARNVQLESPEKANDLIREKVIILFDQTVDVRPYVNIYAKSERARSRSRIMNSNFGLSSNATPQMLSTWNSRRQY